MQKSTILLTIIVAINLVFIFSLDCLDQNGNSIDWFTAINFPGKVQDAQSSDDRKYYAYYDINSDNSNQATFTLGEDYIDTSSSAVYNTLNQLTQSSDYEVVAWNDGGNQQNLDLMQIIYKHDPDNSTYIFTTGHAKGVIALDLNSQTGFILSHSMPNFPDITNGMISPIVPNSAKVYGQSFFCMSVDQQTLERVAQQLYIENPRVYFTQSLSSQTPNIYAMGNLNNDSSSDYSFEKQMLKFQYYSSSSELLQRFDFTLRLNSTSVTIFTKSQKASGMFIFEDLICPSLNVSINVESWGRPWMSPNCSIRSNGNLYTTNIQDVQINENIYWSSYNDHSKWITSVDSSNPYICIGDNNRMTSQNVRGGSFFCQNNQNLWSVFNNAIEQVDNSCSSSFFMDQILSQFTTTTIPNQSQKKFLQQ